MANKEFEMTFRLSAQLGNNFSGSFKKAQAELTAMQRDVVALNRTQADIKGYQKQQEAVEESQQKIAKLQEEYNRLQKELGETEAGTKKLAQAQKDIGSATKKLDVQTEKLNKMGGALKNAGVDTSKLGSESARLSSELGALQGKQDGVAEMVANFGLLKGALAGAGVAIAIREIGQAFAAASREAVAFESAMAGVAKTTDLSKGEFARLSGDIKALSTQMPATSQELAGVAEAAGQLGIAKEDLLGFTETMTMLGTSTNMSAQEAATSLARFANITKMAASDYDEIGSSVVALGNNFATTEAEIVAMGMRLASAGSLSGLSQADIMGVSTALSSLGIEAEAGGTAVSKLMRQFETMVATGDKNLTNFAAVANMSAAEFSAAWGEDAVAALSSFVTGLGAVDAAGGSSIATLDDLGITEQRMTDAILRMASNGGILEKAISMSNSAWEENNALSKEAAQRYATTESKAAMAANAVTNLKVAVGDAYSPAVKKAYEWQANWAEQTAIFVEENQVAVQAVSAFVGVMTLAGTGIAAYTVYVSLASKASAIFTAASAALKLALPHAAVIGGISLAVAGLAAAFVAVKGIANECKSELDGINKTFEDSMTGTLATANAADRYIDKLEQLESAGVKTEAQQKEYHSTLALLCETMPELKDKIDLETNSIEGGTAALRINTAAWRENAKQKVYQEKMEALYKKQAELQLEIEKNNINITKSEIALEDASAKAAEKGQESGRLWMESGVAAGAYQTSEELRAFNEELRQNEAAMDAVGQEITLTEDAFASMNGAVADGEAALAAHEKQGGKTARSVAEIQGEIDQLKKGYQEAYDAARISLEGQFNLWEKVELPEIKTPNLMEGMESQSKVVGDYAQNLATLRDRASEIEGLSEFVANFADGSAESMQIVANLASALPGDLQALVGEFQALKAAKDEAAKVMGEFVNDYGIKMQQLNGEMKIAMENLGNTLDTGTDEAVAFMEKSEEAKKAADSTTAAYGDSAIKAIPAVKQKFKRLADAAKAELQANGFFSISFRGSGGESDIDGSAKNGLDYVPFDGYRAELHKGERVLTAEEAQEYRGAAPVQLAQRAIEALPAANTVTLRYAPNYRFEGIAQPEEVQRVLQGHDEQMRDFILSVLQDAGVDQRRRAYV